MVPLTARSAVPFRGHDRTRCLERPRCGVCRSVPAHPSGLTPAAGGRSRQRRACGAGTGARDDRRTPGPALRSSRSPVRSGVAVARTCGSRPEVSTRRQQPRTGFDSISSHPQPASDQGGRLPVRRGDRTRSCTFWHWQAWVDMGLRGLKTRRSLGSNPTPATKSAITRYACCIAPLRTAWACLHASPDPAAPSEFSVVGRA